MIGKSSAISLVMIWMLSTMANLILYSTDLIQSFIACLMSFSALVWSNRNVKELEIKILPVVMLIWLTVTLFVLNCVKNWMMKDILSIKSNSGIDGIINDLQEGVVILDEETNKVAFSNTVANNKLKVKEGKSL